MEEHEEFVAYILTEMNMDEHDFAIFIDKRNIMDVEELISQLEDVIKRKKSGR